MRRVLVTALAAVGLSVAAPTQAAIMLPLTTGSGNKIDAGTFNAGETLVITASGQGDLVDARFQVFADGSLPAPATGAFTFANPGAPYPALFGGDGVNHFAGGGANYDFTGSGFGFAGENTTDTTDPDAIRFGAVVGTFVANPTQADWFLIGTGANVVVPVGGATLYLAVNDSFPGDNHGTYTVDVSVAPAAVPEPASLALLGVGAAGLVGVRFRRRAARA